MIGDDVTFRVEGIPVPQGSKKGFVVGKRAVLVDDNKNSLKPWRAEIAKAADLGVRFEGAVAVSAVFYLPRPKSVKRDLPTVVPDLDKLMRALGDGMKDGGLLRDDSIICDENIKKRYADGCDPGVTVTVREIASDGGKESS